MDYHHKTLQRAYVRTQAGNIFQVLCNRKDTNRWWTMNITKEIQFVSLFKSFFPHLEPLNWQEFCSSDSFMFLISSVEGCFVVEASPYVLWKCLQKKTLEDIHNYGSRCWTGAWIYFFRLSKQYFISCTPNTECICPTELTITPSKILNQE